MYTFLFGCQISIGKLTESQSCNDIPNSIQLSTHISRLSFLFQIVDIDFEENKTKVESVKLEKTFDSEIRLGGIGLSVMFWVWDQFYILR